MLGWLIMANWKVLGILSAAVLLGTSLTVMQGPGQATVPARTQISGVDVSGMTQEQAQQKLATDLDSKLQAPVIIASDTRKWQVTRADLGMKLDVPAMVRSAMEGDLQADKPHWVPLILTVDAQALRGYVEKKIAPEALHPGKGAKLRIGEGNFVIVPGLPGKAMDIDKFVAQVMAAPAAQRFDVILAPTPPPVTEQDLAPIDTHLMHFETRFNRGVRGRTQNLLLASALIDGTFLRPGDVFSFNKVVGVRSTSRGFKTAHVYVEGVVTEGVGGGMCQISTTLYNVALLADLGIVERHSHMFPVPYVPLGRDAAVSYGSKDFRFRNTTSGPLYLATGVKGSKLYVDLYGTTPLTRRVRIISVHSHAKGGSSSARVYREVLENGVKVSKELLTRDRYKPLPTVLTPPSQVRSLSLRRRSVASE